MVSLPQNLRGGVLPPIAADRPVLEVTVNRAAILADPLNRECRPV